MKNIQIGNSSFANFEMSYGGRFAAGLLSGNWTYMRKIYMTVHDAVSNNIEEMDPQQRYKAAQLCGPNVWSGFTFKGQRCAAGICLSYLVKTGVLKLRHHKTKSGKGCNKYYKPVLT